MRRVDHQPQPAAGRQHGQQRGQPRRRVRQMVQHAAAIDVVERSKARPGQVKQRALLPHDVGQLAGGRACLGDGQRGGGAIQPCHAAGAASGRELLCEHEGGVAGSAPGDQRVQRAGRRTAGAEHKMVDLQQMAGTADDQPLRLIARVAAGIGIGFILRRQLGVGAVCHESGNRGRWGRRPGAEACVWGAARAAAACRRGRRLWIPAE